jgi:hypothetical protein
MGALLIGCGGGGGGGGTGGAGGASSGTGGAGTGGSGIAGANGGAGGATGGAGAAGAAGSGAAGAAGSSAVAGSSGTGGTSGSGGAAGNPGTGGGAAGNPGTGGGAAGNPGTGGGAAGNPGTGGGAAGNPGTGGGAAGNPGTGGGAAGSPGTGGGGAGGNAGSTSSGGASGGSGGGASGGAGTGGTAGAGGNTGTGGTAGAAGDTGSGGDAGASGAGGAAGESGMAGASGNAGVGGSAGNPGSGGAAAGAGGSGTCQDTISFTRRTPTVLILVDRGGSEFDTATTGTFFNVRSAVEDVIATVDGQFRLGFAAYVGQHTGTTCGVVYDSVPFSTSNAVAIKAEYDLLGPLQPYPTAKAETPATEAIPLAEAALDADTGTAGRYLLFITTGATDFCDDANNACPPDAVTYQIQQLWAHAPSIATLVVGLPAATNNPVAAGVLQDYANAGVGQPAAFPTGTPYTATTLSYACSINTDGGNESWPSLFAAAGKTAPGSIATYSTTGGTAPLFVAPTNAVADIEPQVIGALAQAKSCAFDVATFSIDPNKLGEATVTLNGTALPQDAGVGWSMPTPTELVLNGPACAAWRTPNAAISFNFPCDTVVSH